jgi:hypothetical protein
MTNTGRRQFLIWYYADRLAIETTPAVRMGLKRRLAELMMNESGTSDHEKLPWPHFGGAVGGRETFDQDALWRERWRPGDVVVACNERVGKQ